MREDETLEKRVTRLEKAAIGRNLLDQRASLGGEPFVLDDKYPLGAKILLGLFLMFAALCGGVGVLAATGMLAPKGLVG